MAGLTHGMNVANVRGIAKQLDSQAAEVERVMSAVDGLIRQAETDWLGPDSRKFQGLWNGTYKRELQRLKGELTDLARKARESAAGQEEESNRL